MNVNPNTCFKCLRPSFFENLNPRYCSLTFINVDLLPDLLSSKRWRTRRLRMRASWRRSWGWRWRGRNATWCPASCWRSQRCNDARVERREIVRCGPNLKKKFILLFYILWHPFEQVLILLKLITLRICVWICKIHQ